MDKQVRARLLGTPMMPTCTDCVHRHNARATDRWCIHYYTLSLAYDACNLNGNITHVTVAHLCKEYEDNGQTSEGATAR